MLPKAPLFIITQDVMLLTVPLVKSILVPEKINSSVAAIWKLEAKPNPFKKRIGISAIKSPQKW